MSQCVASERKFTVVFAQHFMLGPHTHKKRNIVTVWMHECLSVYIATSFFPSLGGMMNKWWADSLCYSKVKKKKKIFFLLDLVDDCLSGDQQSTRVWHSPKGPQLLASWPWDRLCLSVCLCLPWLFVAFRRASHVAVHTVQAGDRCQLHDKS